MFESFIIQRWQYERLWKICVQVSYFCPVNHWSCEIFCFENLAAGNIVAVRRSNTLIVMQRNMPERNIVDYRKIKFFVNKLEIPVCYNLNNTLQTYNNGSVHSH